MVGPFTAGGFFEGTFFGATFLEDEAFLVGLVNFFRGFLATARFGVDFARVWTFDFFFLEPAMVALTAPPVSPIRTDIGIISPGVPPPSPVAACLSSMSAGHVREVRLMGC